MTMRIPGGVGGGAFGAFNAGPGQAAGAPGQARAAAPAGQAQAPAATTAGTIQDGMDQVQGEAKDLVGLQGDWLKSNTNILMGSNMAAGWHKLMMELLQLLK